tara:strand:+ start:158 stop:385 length:228 start_codon:yes stop_codon:yes gene_type:complete
MEHSHMADWETHNNHQIPMDIKRKIGYFPDEYKKLMQGKLSKRQIEILDGADLKAQEGMIFGQMYADWKDKTNPW